MSRPIEEILHKLTNTIGRGPMIVKSLSKCSDTNDEIKMEEDLQMLESLGQEVLQLVEEFRRSTKRVAG